MNTYRKEANELADIAIGLGMNDTFANYFITLAESTIQLAVMEHRIDSNHEIVEQLVKERDEINMEAKS